MRPRNHNVYDCIEALWGSTKNEAVGQIFVWEGTLLLDP